MAALARAAGPDNTAARRFLQKVRCASTLVPRENSISIRPAAGVRLNRSAASSTEGRQLLCDTGSIHLDVAESSHGEERGRGAGCRRLGAELYAEKALGLRVRQRHERCTDAQAGNASRQSEIFRGTPRFRRGENYEALTSAE